MPETLSQAELFDALAGLMAYDLGATDSGIHDERLRQRVQAHLKALDEEQLRLTLSRFVRKTFLTEVQLAQRYGIESVMEFVRWLDHYMKLSL